MYVCVYVYVCLFVHDLRCGHATPPSSSSAITPPALTTGGLSKTRPLYQTMRLVSLELCTFHVRSIVVVIGLFHALCTLDESDVSSRNRSRLRRSPPQEGEAWHCLYGFKRDLVQLLGTLLYQCTAMQDRMRERGVVTLILNQCGIDHRNPCILLHILPLIPYPPPPQPYPPPTIPITSTPIPIN